MEEAVDSFRVLRRSGHLLGFRSRFYRFGVRVEPCPQEAGLIVAVRVGIVLVKVGGKC